MIYKCKIVSVKVFIKIIFSVCLSLFLAIAFAEDIVTEQHNIPYKGEEELDVGIEFSLGKLEIKSCQDNNYIMQSEITYSKELYKPSVQYKTIGNRGKLRLVSKQQEKSHHWGGSKKKSSSLKNNHWRITLIETVPIAFNIEMGLGKGLLDFSGLRVNDLDLDCGLSDVVVEFSKSNKEKIRRLSIETGLGNVEANGLGYANLERFNIECGLGSTTLRFDGDLSKDVKGRIAVGLGSVNVKIPKDYAVQIEAQSSFLSSLNFNDFRRIDEDVYRSKNWENAEHRIFMIVEIGLGSVDVDWIK